MAAAEALSRASALMMEAAYDADRWPAALDGMAEACGARSGQLICLNGAGDITAHWLTEVPEDFVGQIEAFGLANPTINPRVRLGLRADVMTPVCDQDHVDAEARARLPIYAEMFNPHDLAFNCQAVVHKDDDLLVRASITRTHKQGPLDGAALDAFTALMPHMRAAVRFQSTLEHARADAVLKTLDALTTAAFLLDGDGRVVGVSAEGEKLAARRDVLRVVSERLMPALDCERPAFEAKLDAAVSAARHGRATCVGPLVARNANGEVAIVLDMQPLPFERASFGRGAAVLAVARPARAVEERASVLTRMYRLTPAEVSVALQIAEGASINDVAEARGVGVATVRTQVQVIFSKMGVHRQGELIAAIRKLG